MQRFQDMIASGVLRDDERIELIDGEMVDMARLNEGLRAVDGLNDRCR